MTPAAESQPRMSLTLTTMLWYSLANLGFGMFYAFNNAALPLYMKHLTSNAVVLGLLAGTHSFEGAIIQPIVGSWSDRLRTPLGRRRPFMLIFVPLSALFLLLTPVAAHLPVGVRLGVTVACVFLFTVTFNIAMDPYTALLPDITPRPQRGRVTGVWMFFGNLGQVAVLLAPVPLGLKFTVVAVLMLATTLITCAAVREAPPKPDREDTRKNHWEELREAMIGLRTLHQARWYLVMFFCYGAGTGAVVPFLTLFIQRITHCTDGEAQKMFVVLMAAAAVGVLPCGWLSDRVGARRMLMVGMGLMGAASLGGLWVHTLPQVSLVMILAGLGTAAQNASAYPLLTRLVPREEIGFYTGLQTTALSIAGPGALALTGLLINHSGYRVIFGVCAVFIVAAIFALLRVQEQSAAAEITRRDSEQGRDTAAAVPSPA